MLGFYSVLSLVSVLRINALTTGIFLMRLSINKHRHTLQSRKIAQVQRWNYENNDYPYRSHGQPFLAYMALIGCLFLLVVSNGAAVWKGFHVLPFLSAYLVVSWFAPGKMRLH